jgi:hypothetical protein
LSSVADLLARGVKVALIYGDADLICNWYGGQNYSLTIASMVPVYKKAFPAAGYADIVVNKNYVGGQVRQFGNLSFSRIYDAGHQVPYYQPETAFTVFTRIIQGNDIGMGHKVDLRMFGTNGLSTSLHQNKIPPQPASFCWIREQDTCTPDQVAVIAAGNGTVEAGIWYPVTPTCKQNCPRPSKTASKSQPRGIDNAEPTKTAEALTGVYTATSTPTEKKTSGASLPVNPFRLFRRDAPTGGTPTGGTPTGSTPTGSTPAGSTPAGSIPTGESKMDKALTNERKIRNGLIGGLAATAALLL